MGNYMSMVHLPPRVVRSCSTSSQGLMDGARHVTKRSLNPRSLS